MQAIIHPTAQVAPGARIGKGTRIWQYCQVRDGATIGNFCILGKDVYVDERVVVGNHVKIQNGISLYNGVELEDGVFCGPHCVFTNDRVPRAINPDGSLKDPRDWVLSKTRVKYGASIGANATIVAGTTIGRWAMIGAGAVITRDVPDYALALGNPARIFGFVDPSGHRLRYEVRAEKTVVMVCPECTAEIIIPQNEYAKLEPELTPDDTNFQTHSWRV